MGVPHKKATSASHAHGPSIQKKPWATLELPTASVHIQELVSGQTPYSTTRTTGKLHHLIDPYPYSLL
jgi:hypothetical protein